MRCRSPTVITPHKERHILPVSAAPARPRALALTPPSFWCGEGLSARSLLCWRWSRPGGCRVRATASTGESNRQEPTASPVPQSPQTPSLCSRRVGEMKALRCRPSPPGFSLQRAHPLGVPGFYGVCVWGAVRGRCGCYGAAAQSPPPTPPPTPAPAAPHPHRSAALLTSSDPCSLPAVSWAGGWRA